MNEQSNTNVEQRTGDERAEWQTPEVKLIRAGEAENNNLATFDGAAGLS